MHNNYHSIFLFPKFQPDWSICDRSWLQSVIMFGESKTVILKNCDMTQRTDVTSLLLDLIGIFDINCVTDEILLKFILWDSVPIKAGVIEKDYLLWYPYRIENLIAAKERIKNLRGMKFQYFWNVLQLLQCVSVAISWRYKSNFYIDVEEVALFCVSLAVEEIFENASLKSTRNNPWKVMKGIWSWEYCCQKRVLWLCQNCDI